MGSIPTPGTTILLQESFPPIRPVASAPQGAVGEAEPYARRRNIFQQFPFLFLPKLPTNPLGWITLRNLLIFLRIMHPIPSDRMVRMLRTPIPWETSG